MPAESVDVVVTRVLTSRRYGGLAPELVRRLAVEEAPKARNIGETEKRVKRRLHQIFGAYATRPDYGRLRSDLRDVAKTGDEEHVRATCLNVMAGHASTRERLTILDTFYTEIFALTGRPANLLDIGCGLNPLAIPWMELPASCPYLAYDIDLELVAFLNDVMPLFDVGGRAKACDVIAAAPQDACDVALLLKAVPCLEQQRPGIGLELLASLNARQIVLSYPTHSLGGHGKGMARTYRDAFERLADALGRPFSALEFPGELVFVLPGSAIAAVDAFAQWA